MNRVAAVSVAAIVFLGLSGRVEPGRAASIRVSPATVHRAVASDRSRPLSALASIQADSVVDDEQQAPTPRREGAPAEAPKSAAGAKVEQTSMGTKASAVL